MNKIELNIKGMTCTSCGNNIRRRISRLNFVTNVNIDWETGKAIVQVTDDNEDNRKTLKDTITKIGYVV